MEGEEDEEEEEEEVMEDEKEEEMDQQIVNITLKKGDKRNPNQQMEVPETEQEKMNNEAILVLNNQNNLN